MCRWELENKLCHLYLWMISKKYVTVHNKFDNTENNFLIFIPIIVSKTTTIISHCSVYQSEYIYIYIFFFWFHYLFLCF